MSTRIEKLKRELYGQRSERTARLIEELEPELELATTPSEDELARGPPRRKPRACAPSRARGPYPSPGRTTSNASASLSRPRRAVPAAAERV
ncbi:hypothetical protein IVB14_03920 [Bradyrhizobium sp. 180]|nr:hypothetical protein [Bradyrhizobium sp. 180]